jgi:hypothetical protein
MSERPTPIRGPERHMAELALVFARVPKTARPVLFVVLQRLAGDVGWHKEVRGLAMVLSGLLEALEDELPDAIEAIEAVEARAIKAGGSFAFAAEARQ